MQLDRGDSVSAIKTDVKMDDEDFCSIRMNGMNSCRCG